MADGTTGPEILARWGGIIDQDACCPAKDRTAKLADLVEQCATRLREGDIANFRDVIREWRAQDRRGTEDQHRMAIAHEVLRQELER